VEAVLRGGAAVVQYRDKSAEPKRRQQEAAAIAALCRHYEALFIVNDDPVLAAAVRADGVHLGQGDMTLPQARRIVGADTLIGVSCYDSLPLAQQAAALGADYVAFGSIYPSATKPQAVRAPLSLLRAARQQLGLPLVAIGGIDADNAAPVIAAGADAIAVISSVFLADDPYAETLRLAALFDTPLQGR
jgi:thiamine-phosphate pyrophosphorylase